MKGKGKPKMLKLPPGLSSRMKAPKQAQQPVPEGGLSAYGRRRKSKMKGV